jgi:hypothetical protein
MSPADGDTESDIALQMPVELPYLSCRGIKCFLRGSSCVILGLCLTQTLTQTLTQRRSRLPLGLAAWSLLARFS